VPLPYFAAAVLNPEWKDLFDRVDDAWRNNHPPNLRKLVDEVGLPFAELDPPLLFASELLYEVVLLDLEYRWSRPADATYADDLGARPWWHDYERIFPEMKTKHSLALWAIAESYWLLRSLGHTIDRQKFIENHPIEEWFGNEKPSLEGLLEFYEADFALENSTPARPAVSKLPDISAPLLFSDYLLEAMLGFGGTGKVYRALQKSTGRYVAIKTLLKKRQRDPEAVAQFVEEARIVQSLSHPAIVATHGLGKYPGGGYFLAMDLVIGQNLQTRLEKCSLLRPTAIDVVGGVAEAMAYAHSRGVLHGDLKPSNVLLDEKMQPHVVDFGMATLLHHAEDAPMPLGGTPAYMAPEQLAGDAPASPATDIYGLGGGSSRSAAARWMPIRRSVSLRWVSSYTRCNLQSIERVGEKQFVGWAS
jgi:tRNA A-37 threonylcarbamoyl transferase component Bud32